MSPPLPQLLAQLTLYLVPAKLDVGALDAQITELGGTVVGRASDARIIITALRGRPRLERALGTNILAVNILSEEFITDAYARARAGSLTLPNRRDYVVLKVRAGREQAASTSDREKRERSASVEVLGTREVGAKRVKWDRETANKEGALPGGLETKLVGGASALPDVVPYLPDIRLRDIPRMCVNRPSPLECPNQDIIDAIKPIYTYREFDEGGQKNSNVLSYRRSMSMLKAVPRRIRSGAEARKLVDVGDKVAQRIDEYLSTGTIAESAEICASERFRALREFATIYSIGTATAAELWSKGCRTLDDVRAHYCGDAGGEGEKPAERRAERKAAQRRLDGTMTRAEVVSAWLNLKPELDQKIPRSEAEEIVTIVMAHVDALRPNCEWTIAGGYRRGKATVADVDVVFSPPAGVEDPELIRALCARLSALGIVSHVLNITTRDPSTPQHSHSANFDNLDKAFVILHLPGEGRLHRRVDLICSPRERYAATVLSWSGSMMFERDMRRVAEDKGYKFRAGLIDRVRNAEINLPSEREILAFLGLPYVPPELRNADG